MKFSYKFSNLLGSVYHKGNLLFTNNGNTVISPVGNKISLFDLKNNKSETLSVESRFNISCLALSPSGCTLIAINEDGDILLISLISKTILHRHRLNRPAHAVKFSPDGKHYAIAKDNVVFLYKAPGPQTREYNPFILERVFKGAYDDTVCLDWTSDSRVLAVGSADMSTRIYAVKKLANFTAYSVGGHSDSIVNCYFEQNSLDMYTVSKNGQICVWECSVSLEDLKSQEEDDDEEKQKLEQDDEEDDILGNSKTITVSLPEEKPSEKKVFYKRIARYYPGDLARSESPAVLSSSAYHQITHIMVTGFSNGSFYLHEMPDYNLIHSLSIANQCISTVNFNASGDWIALGCQQLGQLLVWEWQSESYIMKQQGHFNNLTCLAYSPDGQYIATGGDDSKVKLWNTSSGFCFVTFTEHQCCISGLCFTENGKVIVSASLDGTVRAYDLLRYRNFRTFTSPRPTQFSCLAVDSSSEIVSAGGQDSFEIFVWSMKTGKLLEILSGHEGPVSSLSFSPNQSFLASVSWDKTLKIWDIFRDHKETINLTSEGLAVTFRPDGIEVAVTTLDAQISFFHVESACQTGNIEGRKDIDSGRKDTDLVTAKKIRKSKAFTTLCYSADGSFILAAGQSKTVCIYSAKEELLVKKFEITQNRSLDGMDDTVNRRKMSDFGNLALLEKREDEDNRGAIRLPGVKKGDMASRAFQPEVRVTCIRFSPTGREWAATTTEGLLVYSLDYNLVFDPYNLEVGITPETIETDLKQRQFSAAVMKAFRLNESSVIKNVMENIPVENISDISKSLPIHYTESLLKFISQQMEESQHLEFYLLWIEDLLNFHGSNLKNNSMKIIALLNRLQKALSKKYEDLRSICDYNKYSMKYLLSLGEYKKKRKLDELEENISDPQESDNHHLYDED